MMIYIFIQEKKKKKDTIFDTEPGFSIVPETPAWHC